MKNTAPNIELTLHPGTTPEDLHIIADAIAEWCALTSNCRVFHELRLTLMGGPYLTSEDTAAFWRAMVPPGAVEDIVIDGTSWMESDNHINPDCDGEADVPDAATIGQRS